MAANQSNALKHWARVIQRWPKDKVRPEAVSFQRIMQYRLQNSGMPLPDTAPLPASKRDPKAPVIEPRVWNEQKETQQANVLFALLENRFSKQYPMPQALRHPASNPSHYDDLLAEMSAAPSRSWFNNVVQRIKGSLRLS